MEMRIVVLACMIFCTTIGWARAERIVIGWVGSNPGTYRLGIRLASEAIVDIPRCATLIIWDGAGVVEFPGPYRGTLDKYSDSSGECREALDEREKVYQRYFREVCRKGVCDDSCKAVFVLLKNNSTSTLRCQ
jgi:hypothetical protein